MSETLKAVREQFETFNLEENVSAALYGMEPPDDDLPKYEVPDWSPVANAYERACAVLSKHPQTQLSDEIVDSPAEISSLGRYFINLVNSSIKRNSHTTFQFEEFGSGYLGVCAQAEVRFASCLGHTNGGVIREEESRQDVYVDEANNPIAFTKGKNVVSSISFEDISINGIMHPAGTIFKTVRGRHAEPIVKERALYINSVDDIESIYPMRLSIFALPRRERIEAWSREISRKSGLNLSQEQTAKRITSYPEVDELGSILASHVDQKLDTMLVA